MRINKLEIKAFRGIDDLTLEFPEIQTTVLVGINGSGKTAILDCLASVLSLFSQQLTYKHEFNLTEEDIKNEYDETEILMHFLIGGESESVGIIRRRQEGEKSTAIINYESLEILRKNLKRQELFFSPILVYYPVNRTFLNVSLEVKENYIFDRRLAYEAALTRGSIDFQQFFEWFRMREDYENEIRLDRDVSYRDRELEAVRTAIHQMLPEFSNPRIKRNPLRMTVKKGDEELQIDQLSDGEKNLLTLFGDIARRLANANPTLDNPFFGQGIVLIDEIELHLHPRWQRDVIPHLEMLFPKCQFIIATHSPQVLSLVKPESIFVLTQTKEGIKAFHPRISYGRDSNQILEEVMDAPERPQEIRDQLKTYFRMIADGELEQAEELREELERKIGKDEPKFVRADGILRRKEIIGR